jgi:pantothenate kinase
VTPEPEVLTSLDDLASTVRAAADRHASGRLLVGITGPPGVGKSTTAARLAKASSGIVVAMDGFHLANEVLRERGLLDRKGAPSTFDAWAFVVLLRRLRDCDPAEEVFAPAFDRRIDAAVAGAVPVPAAQRLVIVEGNYLLHDAAPWDEVAPMLDVVVHLDLDPAVRRQRLVDRHVAFGRSASDAGRFVAASDEPNARLVERGRHRAHVVLRLEP